MLSNKSLKETFSTPVKVVNTTSTQIKTSNPLDTINLELWSQLSLSLTRMY